MNWQPGVTLEEIEREVVISALKFYQWNRTRTANALDVSIRTIQNKIAKYVEEGHLSESQIGPCLPLDKEEEAPPKRELTLRRRKEYSNA